MRKIEKPNIDLDEIVNDCITNYRDIDLRDRFKQSIPKIKEYTNTFEDSILSMTIHNFKSSSKIGKVSSDEMQKLYIEKFSKDGHLARKHYDEIMALAPFRKCPYCATKEVRTLDHYMPKSKYSALSVSPINLIPCCRDCNTTKKDVRYTKYTDTHIHPYFDNIDTHIWLTANLKLDSDKTLSITYTVIKPDEWNDDLFNRVLTHFYTFDLNNVFSFKAIDEINNITPKFRDVFLKTNNLDIVYQDLHETLKSHQENCLNSWQTALYQALIKDNTYIKKYLPIVAKRYLDMQKNKP